MLSLWWRRKSCALVHGVGYVTTAPSFEVIHFTNDWSVVKGFIKCMGGCMSVDNARFTLWSGICGHTRSQLVEVEWGNWYHQVCGHCWPWGNCSIFYRHYFDHKVCYGAWELGPQRPCLEGVFRWELSCRGPAQMELGEVLPRNPTVWRVNYGLLSLWVTWEWRYIWPQGHMICHTSYLCWDMLCVAFGQTWCLSCAWAAELQGVLWLPWALWTSVPQ